MCMNTLIYLLEEARTAILRVTRACLAHRLLGSLVTATALN
jgi:hypothetical protein